MNKLGRVMMAAAVSLTALSSGVSAKEVTILAGELPPMFNGGNQGREAEIITAALERCGHTATFRLMPFTRHWDSYSKGQGDAVTTVPVGMPIDGFASDTYIQYQNGVSFLSEATAGYADLSALSGRSVIAFKGASEIIPGLKDAVASFKSYKEVADQEVQSKMIFGGRVDAVIGDGMIFAAYNANLRENAGALQFNPNQDVTFSAIFAPSEYVLSFRDQELTADFNRCFAEIRDDGTLAKLNTQWAERYRDTLGDQYLGH